MPEGQYTMLKPTNGTPYWVDYSPKEGAYYYACGGSVATYHTASGIIILPSNINLLGTGNGRNAYISFGVDGGSAGAIDIGLRNFGVGKNNPAGDGWEAVCYECNEDVLYTLGKAPRNAKRARIEVTPNRVETNKIRFFVEWLDNSNNVIDSSTTYNDEFELSKNYSWTAFYRFASMVTWEDSASRSDSTYMLGGEFMNVKVGSSNWGISTSTIDRAWIINHPKCQLPDGYWATGEQFRIDHWA